LIIVWELIIDNSDIEDLYRKISFLDFVEKNLNDFSVFGNSDKKITETQRLEYFWYIRPGGSSL
jgi:hypothetical protein